MILSTGLRVVFGRITKITDGALLYAGIGPLPYDEELCFAPRLIDGYEGQSLERLGAELGTLVRILWDPVARSVKSAELIR